MKVGAKVGAMREERRVLSAADVGRLVRETRQAASMTQQELADRVGTTRQWVIRLEQGHPTPTMNTVLIVLSELGLELIVTHNLPQRAPRNALERRMAKLLS